MSNIITHIELANLRDIGGKYNTDKVEQSITRAQADLRGVMGASFYFDVIKNIEDPAYAELLEGSEFEFNGVSLFHEGLKSVVADYAYGRYIYEVNVTPTPFGMVQKSNQDSEPIDRNLLKDLIKQNNIDASNKWDLIEKYLEVNKDTFEVWYKQQESNELDITNNNNTFNSTRFTFLKSGDK